MAVALIVAIGSRSLGRVTADLFRADSAVAGYGLGRCDSELSLRPNLFKPREGYKIAVRVEGSGLHLPGSPYVLGPAVRVVR